MPSEAEDERTGVEPHEASVLEQFEARNDVG